MTSTAVGGIRIYAYSFQGAGQLGIAGELEPSFIIGWANTGQLEVQSADGGCIQPNAAPAFENYRNAFTAAASCRTSGLILLVPRTEFGRQQAGALRWKANSAQARLIVDCFSELRLELSKTGSGKDMARQLRLALFLLREMLEPEPVRPAATFDASAPWYVAMSERVLAERMPSSICMESLAGIVGISPRTLHDGFRKHKGSSPMRFLREQRMEAVREELLHPSVATSVTETAVKWGFNHLGRFSGYYERQFGELPSETLARARGARPDGMRLLAARAGA